MNAARRHLLNLSASLQKAKPNVPRHCRCKRHCEFPGTSPHRLDLTSHVLQDCIARSKLLSVPESMNLIPPLLPCVSHRQFVQTHPMLNSRQSCHGIQSRPSAFTRVRRPFAETRRGSSQSRLHSNFMSGIGSTLKTKQQVSPIRAANLESHQPRLHHIPTRHWLD